jgi:hypothetical protein
MKFIPKLSKVQWHAWDTLHDATTELLLYGGAGYGGKTYLGCVWLLSMMITYPNTRYFVVRKKITDVIDSTIQVFWEVCQDYSLSKDLFATNEKANTITYIPTNSTIKCMECMRMPSDPLYNRFGSKNFTCGWIEEAQEIEKAAMERLDLIVGRCKNKEYGIKKKLLMTCNPSKNWLYTDIYRIRDRLPARFEFIQALPTDNEFGDQNYIEGMRNSTSIVQRQRMYEGKWEYDDEPGQLVMYSWLTNLLDVYGLDGVVHCGVDPAEYGANSDQSTIQIVIGNRVLPVQAWRGSDYKGRPEQYDEWCADQVITAMQYCGHTWEAKNIVIDTVGVGSGLWSALRSKGHTCTRFEGGARAMVRHGDKRRYKNLRSQAYWELREKIRQGQLALDELDEQLADDLQGVHYQDSDTVITIEDKKETRKRLGRSPDKADALMMACWQIPRTGGSGTAVQIQRKQQHI